MSRGKRTDIARCSCVICRREFSNAGIDTHVLRSHDDDPRFHTSGHHGEWRGSNHYIKAKALGLEKPQLSCDELARRRDQFLNHNRLYWTAANRLKHSKIMCDAVARLPESYGNMNVLRRPTRHMYNGHYLHSSWEVIVAEFLDSIGVRWSRDVKWFPYEFNGSVRKYFPDFYLPDTDTYVEVKGYKTNKDAAKWDQFPGRLIIVQEYEISLIRRGEYQLKVLED